MASDEKLPHIPRVRVGRDGRQYARTSHKEMQELARRDPVLRRTLDRAADVAQSLLLLNYLRRALLTATEGSRMRQEILSEIIRIEKEVEPTARNLLRDAGRSPTDHYSGLEGLTDDHS